MQRRYYDRNIQALQKDHLKRWWDNIRDIAGVNENCDSLRELAYSHCAGKLDVLADDVCDFLQTVTLPRHRTTPSSRCEQILTSPVSPK